MDKFYEKKALLFICKVQKGRPGSTKGNSAEYPIVNFVDKLTKNFSKTKFSFSIFRIIASFSVFSENEKKTNFFPFLFNKIAKIFSSNIYHG